MSGTPGADNPRDEILDEVGSRLDKGLKNCRAMVADYRLLLTPESNEEGLEAEDSVDSSDEIANP
jgi:hypothetical protein